MQLSKEQSDFFINDQSDRIRILNFQKVFTETQSACLYSFI